MPASTGIRWAVNTGVSTTASCFAKLVPGLLFGRGYERLGDRSCSASTLRRRRDEWIATGLFDRLRRSVLPAYERLFALDLADASVDGCITTAPCGGESAVRSPVDRAKQAPSAGSSPTTVHACLLDKMSLLSCLCASIPARERMTMPFVRDGLDPGVRSGPRLAGGGPV